jgi:predicted GNAT family acetyltransferase
VRPSRDDHDHFERDDVKETTMSAHSRPHGPRRGIAAPARESIEMTGHTDVSVVDNARELRYELHLDGVVVAAIRYRIEPGARVLVDVDVEPRPERHGLGSRLVKAALDDLRARGLAVVPHALFVADFINRHPEYSDLVGDDPEVSD